jgi:hypothetical protein
MVRDEADFHRLTDFADYDVFAVAAVPATRPPARAVPLTVPAKR